MAAESLDPRASDRRAEMSYIECPCCGEEGAYSDGNGEYFDGQSLICGCPGIVSADSEEDPWINNGEEPCPKCNVFSPPTGEKEK